MKLSPPFTVKGFKQPHQIQINDPNTQSLNEFHIPLSFIKFSVYFLAIIRSHSGKRILLHVFIQAFCYHSKDDNLSILYCIQIDSIEKTCSFPGIKCDWVVLKVDQWKWWGQCMEKLIQMKNRREKERNGCVLASAIKTMKFHPSS